MSGPNLKCTRWLSEYKQSFNIMTHTHRHNTQQSTYLTVDKKNDNMSVFHYTLFSSSVNSVAFEGDEASRCLSSDHCACTVSSSSSSVEACNRCQACSSNAHTHPGQYVAKTSWATDKQGLTSWRISPQPTADAQAASTTRGRTE